MATSAPWEWSFVFGDHEPGLSIEEVARQSQCKFVRGDTQMSPYDPERKATGHVLTALEAYRTFGLDILVEAVEYGSAIILSERGAIESSLQNRRKELGLSEESVARAVRLSSDAVSLAEINAYGVSIQDLERIAFILGLDESALAYHPTSGADERLAVRLRTLQSEPGVDDVQLSAGAILTLAEAASIIRVQSQLQDELGIGSRIGEFEPDPNYGYSGNPAWRVGYNLAERTRQRLGLGDVPIESMRGLVEDTLYIPVIQTRLPEQIAGATVAIRNSEGREYRGIVLNTVGQNQNVWVRRATLAHEVGHLLHDPEDRLEKTRVDSYDANNIDPEVYSTDYVEQRANAFAIAFLAPNDAVRRLAPTPISGESVSDVMRTFGISRTSAQFHVSNAWYRQFDMPSVYDIPETWPSYEQIAVEDFAADYFPIERAPIQRRGKFAGLVAAGYERKLISDHTAAAYLDCEVVEFHHALETIKGLYPIT